MHTYQNLKCEMKGPAERFTTGDVNIEWKSFRYSQIKSEESPTYLKVSAHCSAYLISCMGSNVDMFSFVPNYF